MTRPLRIEFAGGVYHVTSRGDRKQQIFRDDNDRARLLGVVGQAMERFDAEVFAYCLMDNHFHFVVHTRRANLSRVMRHVNGVYTQCFNRRHDLTGHLFQGRYHSIHVDTDAYLMALCRYVERNRVAAGLVATPAEWTWSSHRANVGAVAPPPWLATATLHAHVLGRDATTAADFASAAAQYADFCARAPATRLWDWALRQEVYLGDDAFIERVQRLIKSERSASKDIPAAQRASPGSWRAGHDEEATLCATTRRAHVDGGMSMAEIARDMRISASTVSRRIAQAERQEQGHRDRVRSCIDARPDPEP